MQYEYDSNGDLSSLVLMTFLLVVLLPITYRTARPKRSQTLAASKFPVVVTDDAEVQAVTRRRPTKSSIGAFYDVYFSFRYITLTLGWAVVAYLAYRIANTKRESNYWNPYDILGISESASEKEIKKHYKKLSIKFHPDKVRLAVNQTLEDVQEQFVGLTKAYKALTDEEVRQNFLDFGHPDGKQDLSVGIALPTWMVEGGKSLWVLAAYCISLLVGLPIIVGRWWYKSARITKDGLLAETAERYFRGLDDKMTTDQIISLLTSAAEFDSIRIPDADVSDLEKVVQQISRVNFTGRHKTVELLLRAHMYRIPLTQTALLEAQALILDKIITLQRGLLSIVQCYGFLDTQMKIFALSPSIVQAVAPGKSPLLQLPFVTERQVERIRNEFATDVDLQQFVSLKDVERKALLQQSGKQYEEVMRVANALPIIEAPRVAYQVEGDDKVTSNAIVQLVFKLRKRGGPPLKASELLDQVPDEGDVEAILSAGDTLAATAVPDTLSWAPYFPEPPKNKFWLSMADVKQDRNIVGPMEVEDIGDRLRTFKIPFQAPPNAGLYTFQVHIRSDTYLGMDQIFHMELNVEETSAVSGKEEDEISEPDEDTVAGQMAAMRGAPVKKTYEHEYESSSEEELTDDSSDDDSDSD